MAKTKPRNSRVCYDRHFRVCNGSEQKDIPMVDGKPIIGLALSFEFRYFVRPKHCKEDIEILFPEDGSIQPDSFYSCYYDYLKGYDMELDEISFSHSLYSTVDYRIEDCAWVWWDDVNEPKSISLETALCLLKSYPDSFNHSDNKPAQNLAYSMNRVNDGTA